MENPYCARFQRRALGRNVDCDFKERKWIDCRDFPDDTGCIHLSGEEDHVLNAAAEHAASVHGKEDTPEPRDILRGMLKDDVGMARA